LKSFIQEWKDSLEKQWRKYKGWGKFFEFINQNKEKGSKQYLQLYEGILREKDGIEALISVLNTSKHTRSYNFGAIETYLRRDKKTIWSAFLRNKKRQYDDDEN